MTVRVLLVHNFYRSSAPSGEDQVFRNEKALLEEAGIEVVPFEKFNDDLDDSTTLKKIDIALSGAWSRESYAEIVASIQENKPDVAHFHNVFPQVSPSAYAACKDNGVPVVQTLHNYRPICPGALLMRDGKPCEACVFGTLLSSLVHRCYRDSLLATAAVAWQIARSRLTGTHSNLVDRYICLTQFAKSRFVLAGFPEEKMVVKPNFLPVRHLPKPKTTEHYAVFVGRLTPEKGVRTLLHAWRKVTGLELRVVGDGDIRNELETFAQQLKLNVKFLGTLGRSEVLEAVAGAAMQIVPSEWYEGLPLVVVEAFGLATPVIASRIGSLGEVVPDGIAGLQFEPRNAEDLADKVNSLLKDPSLRVTLGENAHRYFLENFTPEKSLASLLSIYEQVIAQKNMRANQ
jgi:glycosyltransferase involved in cell wall biosynthesis